MKTVKTVKAIVALGALAVGAVVVVTTAVACPVTQPPPPGETDRREVIANVVDAVVLPALTDFNASIAAVRAAADAEDRPTAQQAWREAMAAWQVLEMVHVGPAGSPADFIGGLGMRERIYAWPVVNYCAIDQQVLVNEFREPGWAETRLANVIGLAAIEYVLFVEGDANECPADGGVNTGGAWAALGTAEIAERRAAYAAVVAADVEGNAAALRDAWTADGGFAPTLKSAGDAGSTFANAQEALDQLYGAWFAVELITKDKRLGIPAGIILDPNGVCAEGVPCPQKAESRFSRTSKENIVVNLQTTRRMFLGIDAAGADGPGFDDLLRDIGAADLATTMTSHLDAAITAASGFEGTLEDALATEPERAQELYESVKAFTDDFKSTFPSTLDLRVPGEGPADND